MQNVITVRKRDKILLTLVAAFVTITFIVVSVFLYSYGKSQRINVERSADELSDAIDTGLEEYLNQKVYSLRVVGTNPEIYSMNRWQQSEFILHNCDGLGFRTLFIVDNEGNGYYPMEGLYKNQSKEQFFSDISTHSIFITEPFYSMGEPITTICVALFNDDGRRVGTLCGTVFLSKIQEMMVHYKSSTDCSVIMINRYGNYIVTTESIDVKNRKSIYDNTENNVAVINETLKNKKGSSGFIEIDGRKYYSSVRYLSSCDWAIIVTLPKSIVQFEKKRVIAMEAAFIICYVLLLAVVLIVIFSWRSSIRRIYTDTVCDCGSRAACAEVIHALEINRKCQVTILYADLNKFKHINDTYGHDKGDEVLKAFSSTLVNWFGDSGFVGRMGGDEFVIIFKDTPVSKVEEKWKQLTEELKQCSLLLNIDKPLTCSHGYAVRKPGETLNLTDILRQADEQMYGEKRKS